MVFDNTIRQRKIAFIVKDANNMTYEEIQKIKHLREVTSVMVEESSNGIEWNHGCKNVTFEKIELSKINNDIPHIRREYYGKNLWVML